MTSTNDSIISKRLLKEINIEKLKSNEKNPRNITKENLERLKRDISNDVEFLTKRPLLVYPKDDIFIVYAGNMRLKACIELGMKTIPVIVDEDIIDKNGNVNQELLTSRIFKDNETYGDYDLDLVIDNYDVEALKELDLPILNQLLDINLIKENNENEINDLGTQSIIKLQFDHEIYLRVLEIINDLKKKYEVDNDAALFLKLIDFDE